MICDTDTILKSLISTISASDEVQSIGISGCITPLPNAGEGDIDIFIYCDKIPETATRLKLLEQMGSLLSDVKIRVFEGGNWGSGDFVRINGVETWLMYFTMDEVAANLDSILSGDFPDKVGGYYPIGRCAMLKTINIMYNGNGFLSSLKEKLSVYPEKLAWTLVKYHLDMLVDTEDLERAVVRKDVR